jgi:hypothetical protein
MDEAREAAGGARDMDHVEDEVECEDLLYVAIRAYEEQTGEEMPVMTVSLSDSEEPRGTPWEEDELPGRFPRLSARFG